VKSPGYVSAVTRSGRAKINFRERSGERDLDAIDEEAAAFKLALANPRNSRKNRTLVVAPLDRFARKLLSRVPVPPVLFSDMTWSAHVIHGRDIESRERARAFTLNRFLRRSA